MDNIFLPVDKLPEHIKNTTSLIKKIGGHIILIKQLEKVKDGKLIKYSAKDSSQSQIEGFEDKFRIKPIGYTARYREKWFSGNEQMYYLTSSALEIYLPFNPTRIPPIKELLALHCEPTFRHNNIITYKTLPHLHFAPARDPLDKSHIALYPTSVNQVFASMDDYYIYFEAALEMINVEILRVLPFGYTF